MNNVLTPKNVKQLSSFLGMCAYYSKFIPNFAKVCEPLDTLKRKNVHFAWELEQQRAFETINAVLVSQPVLRLLKFRHSIYCSNGCLFKHGWSIFEAICSWTQLRI